MATCCATLSVLSEPPANNPYLRLKDAPQSAQAPPGGARGDAPDASGS